MHASRYLIPALVGMLALSAAPALADTYLVVANDSDGRVRVGTTWIEKGEAAWSALRANIRHDDGLEIVVEDRHQQCTAGGWAIRFTTTDTETAEADPVVEDYCIELAFAEIGCILVAFTDHADGTLRYGWEKDNLGSCAGTWWEGHGRRIIADVMDEAGRVAEIATKVKTKR